MTGTESLLSALRAKALAACEVDGGPWEYDGRDIFTRSHRGAAEHHLILPLPETWHDSQRVPAALAEFIAACDPKTILAILGRLEAAEKRLNAPSDRSFSL